MNTIKIAVMIVGCLMAGMSPAFSAQQAHEPQGKSQQTIPATAAEILTVVEAKLVELERIIAAKKLEQVHSTAFEIRDLLLALPEKVALPETDKKQLSASLGKIKQQASLLDKFGDAGDSAQTSAVFGKFKEEIEKIKKVPGVHP